MQNNLRDTVAPQAQVTKEFYPDIDEQLNRMSETQRGDVSRLYPGGNNKNYFVINPGQLLLKRKNTDVNGREYVFNTLAGLPKDPVEAEEWMRDMDWSAIALVQANKSMETDNTRAGGFAGVVAGTVSTINNGPNDIQAGDLIAWRPPTEKEIRTQQGTALNTPLPVLVPFNKLDLMPNEELMLKSINTIKIGFGVKDKDISELYDRRNKLNPLQYEALGFKWGELLKAAKWIEYYFNTVGGDEANARKFAMNFLTAAMADPATYLRHMVKGEIVKDKDPGDGNAEVNAIYEKYGEEANLMAQKAREAAFHERRRRLVGVALNGAVAYKGTLDALLRLH